MRPLILDEKAKVEIARVKKNAEDNRMDHAEMQRRVAAGGPVVGDDPRFFCNLMMGFKVVFTMEQQPQLGWCYHMSVSVDAEDKLPHQVSVQMLLQEFGINKPLGECYVFIEREIVPNAVNVVVPVEV